MKRLIVFLIIILLICGCAHDVPPLDPVAVEIDKASMPFDREAYGNWSMGMWPFCVHGGEHPEGHGGIDFELKKDTDILAPCSGRVHMVEIGEYDADGIFIECQGIIANIFGLRGMNLKKGDMVKEGEIIGKAADMGPISGFIHFEIITNPGGKRVCPLDYMEEDFRMQTEEMFKYAYYDEQEDEPLLCNCEVAPPPK
jgi:hypothetical protein